MLEALDFQLPQVQEFQLLEMLHRLPLLERILLLVLFIRKSLMLVVFERRSISASNRSSTVLLVLRALLVMRSRVQG